MWSKLAVSSASWARRAVANLLWCVPGSSPWRQRDPFVECWIRGQNSTPLGSLPEAVNQAASFSGAPYPERGTQGSIVGLRTGIFLPGLHPQEVVEIRIVGDDVPFYFSKREVPQLSRLQPHLLGNQFGIAVSFYI